MSPSPPRQPGTPPQGTLPPGTKPFGLSGLIATWFGAGRLPVAPGTWGSLAALPFAWAFIQAGGLVALIIATVAATLVGVWAGGKHAYALGRHDPGEIVIDEVAGQWLATIPIAVAETAIATGRPTWLLWLIAFAAFRLFDITKPWPARRVEHWPEGFGIMADDIVAGFYAALVVAIALTLL